MRYGITIFFLLIFSLQSPAQEAADFFTWTQKKQVAFLNSLGQKFGKLEQDVTAKTIRSLRKLRKEEAKLSKRLKKKDAAAATRLFGSVEENYLELEKRLLGDKPGHQSKPLREYIPAFDSLKTALLFLDKTISPDHPLYQQLTTSKLSLIHLETRLQSAAEIRRLLKQRKDFLNEQLGNLGLSKYLKPIKKEVYYYQQQLSEFKAMLNDPDKLSRKAIALLRETSAFKEFFKKNSMLARLFRLPENYGSPESLALLQTRSGMQQVLSQQISGGGLDPRQFMQQQLSAANNRLTSLRNKLGTPNIQGSHLDNADGFTPNEQKTKSFLERLEYTVNMQTQRPNNLFPVTTDFALSIGYKLNDRSVVGLGGSYKLGLGSGWEQIRLSNEGIGIRSFIAWKLKGSFWIDGGYEQNYFHRFDDFQQISDENNWKQSALLGISKKVKLKNDKSTQVQLLYDFFHDRNIRTQPLLFRIGFQF